MNKGGGVNGKSVEVPLFPCAYTGACPAHRGMQRSLSHGQKPNRTPRGRGGPAASPPEELHCMGPRVFLPRQQTRPSFRVT